ncbi:urease accessory protein UreE [Collinsella aerofaciens]|uniref:urease accessory protein UreE n=1 Tax=Collinsella aerofaciens TaxID=74426 RepID=UPI0034A2A1FF
MPVNLVSTACLGNLNDPSYELLLRRELGGVFGVDELLLDWDQADARTFVGVTELGRTVDIRLGAADGDRLADGDVLVIDRSGIVPMAVVVRLRSAEVYLVEVDRMDPIALAHACWEIGNMHAPLFRGDSDEHTVRMYTPVQPVLGRMLRGVEGVRLSVVTRELDADRRFASSAADAVVSMAPDFAIVKKGARLTCV